ncbi:hypothetical protein UPYG_G00228290 [Umbra pygmaea]|uniref:RING-type domain-containing protein n=1 Tax=Umbra pygmaea TaxID=75934 RepID=A0ABD0WXB2_UMBPY
MGASVIIIHSYFNVWLRAQTGWRSFLLRQEAAKKINSLPQATANQLHQHNDVCAICFQEMNSAVLTYCGHFFHGNCLRKVALSRRPAHCATSQLVPTHGPTPDPIPGQAAKRPAGCAATTSERDCARQPEQRVPEIRARVVRTPGSHLLTATSPGRLGNSRSQEPGVSVGEGPNRAGQVGGPVRVWVQCHRGLCGLCHPRIQLLLCGGVLVRGSVRGCVGIELVHPGKTPKSC